MLASGLPTSDAILYFLPEGADELIARRWHDVWATSPLVKAAYERLTGGKWSKMSLEERIKLALSKQYAEMAYFLYKHNYAALTGFDKTKADDCRKALEARQAGLEAGSDPLRAFFNDLVSGKVAAAVTPPAAASLWPQVETKKSIN